MKRIITTLIICTSILYGQSADIGEGVKKKEDIQKSVTLNEAIEIALKNNYELKIKGIEIGLSLSGLEEAKRFPNPTFAYTEEMLKDNINNIPEKTVMGFLPLNFLWERWSNVASKEKILEAENETGKDLILETAFTTARSYLEFHYTSELYQIYRGLQEGLSRITENAANRLKSGDVSEYEYKRISLAAVKLENILSTTSIDLQSKVNELKLVSGLDVDNIRTVKPNYKQPEIIDIESLTRMAIQNRNDLKSSLLQLDAADKSIDYEKSKIIPEISFGIGYKKIEPEVKGIVFQFEFSLPLFKRNQHGIEISELTKRRFEAEYNLKVNKIKNEVAEAGKKVIVYQEQYESLLKIFDEELFTTASFSYEKGELTLVEYIDAINAYLDALNLKISSEKNYLISIYELNRKIGLIGSKQ